MSYFYNILVRFEQWLDAVAHHFFSLWGKHKVGILGTTALNIVIVILFFILELRSRPHLHDTMVLIDFDREFTIKPEEKPEEATPLLPKDAIDPKYEWEAIRNIAVDATKEDLNPGLIDEKNIDADELYQDAQRLREQMQRNRDMWEMANNEETIDAPNVPEKVVPNAELGQYMGPTVISYFLVGRRALQLPVPAYKCENGGQVVVDIEVLRDGSVSRASIDSAVSVIDECMNNAAIEAARRSVFSVSESLTSRQSGSITYLFVPQ